VAEEMLAECKKDDVVHYEYQNGVGCRASFSASVSKAHLKVDASSQQRRCPMAGHNELVADAIHPMAPREGVSRN